MHRPADHGDHPAVLELRRLGFGASFGHLLETVGDVTVDVAGEIACGQTVHQEIVQRRAGARMLGPQAIHLDIAIVAQHQACRAVEHAQALGHIVERSAQQSRLAAPTVVDEKAGQCGGAEGERRRHDGGGDRSRRLRQSRDDPAGTGQQVDQSAHGKAARSCDDDELPVAAGFSQGWTAKHRVRARSIGRP